MTGTSLLSKMAPSTTQPSKIEGGPGPGKCYSLAQLIRRRRVCLSERKLEVEPRSNQGRMDLPEANQEVSYHWGGVFKCLVNCNARHKPGKTYSKTYERHVCGKGIVAYKAVCPDFDQSALFADLFAAEFSWSGSAPSDSCGVCHFLRKFWLERRGQGQSFTLIDLIVRHS